MADGEGHRVVVGIDGSGSGDEALHHAFREAARRGVRVVAVSVWDPPIRSFAESFGLESYDSTKWDAAHEKWAREHVDRVVAEVPEARGVAIEVQAHTGRPADLLVEAARGADLLVVGHRGRRGLGGLGLGSVALSCVLHAPCPVLVVPSTADRA